MTPPVGIAIVGAGAAGLAAAWELVRLGARDVVVYEAAADVGGKVCSASLGPEGRAAELGQLAIGAGYDRTLALARQVGVDVVSMSGRSFALDGGTIALEDLHAVQAAWIRWRHAVLAATDDVGDRSVFDVLSSLELDDAFTNSMARVLWTACGYGALTSTSTPAIYLRRYLQRVATDEPVTLRVPEGNQHLWRTIRTALASRAVVETGAVVTSVAPADTADGGVVVRLAYGEVRCFAQVVLAVPPAVAATIIDDDVTAPLLRRYQTLAYRAALVTLPGLNARLLGQTAAAGAAWSQQRRGGGGRMVRVGTIDEERLHRPQVLWGMPGHDDLFIIYQYGHDVGTLDGAIVDVAREVGVADPSVLQARQWAYFPHLGIDERRATEQALDERQGQGGVWLTGAWRTFETVEHAVVDGEAVARAVCNRMGGRA
jgi:predicted NAD/FAD-binding protein